MEPAKEAAPATATQAAPAPATVAMFSMSNFLDQGDTTSFPMLEFASILLARNEYISIAGGKPIDCVAPTPHQLSALAHRLHQRGVPYADFGVFGPFGTREALLRKFEDEAFVDGVLTKRFVKGLLRTSDGWHRGRSSRPR